MRLTCIRDKCPKAGLFVDYRRCLECHSFAGQVEFGTVDCNHPEAKKGGGYSGSLKDIFPTLCRQTY